MKKFILGIVLLISGILGIGLTLIANGSHLAGYLYSDVLDVYSNYLGVFSFVSIIGLIMTLIETFKPNQLPSTDK